MQANNGIAGTIAAAVVAVVSVCMVVAGMSTRDMHRAGKTRRELALNTMKFAPGRRWAHRRVWVDGLTRK